MMVRVLPRLSKLIFILIPILLVSTLVLQNVTALSADVHVSHDVVPQAIINYGVEPALANFVPQNPFLALRLEQSSSVGQWSGIAQWPLVAIHNQLMPDGRVFMWDRENDFSRSFKMYNPSTGNFTSLPNLSSSVFCAGFDLLIDGRILVNGGHLTNDSYGLVQTNIYNPASNSWSRGGDMAYARWYPTTLTLGDGRILTAGGEITPNVFATIPEIFNPTNNRWTSLPNANLNIRNYPNLHLLPNGKVLLVYTGAPVRVLDIAAGQWTKIGTSTAPSGFTSVQYKPGKIMQSGKGVTTSVIDMNSGSPVWRITQSMRYSRYNHNLIVLPDGKVLAIGGSSDNTNSDASGILPAELWDPNTETWSTVASMATPRMYHSMAMLMPDGRVMVAGGGRATVSQTTYLNAEFYSPPYLFKGTRPTISYAPSQAPYGANMTILTPNADSITSAVLIPNPSVTHAFNMNQRYVPLTFTRNDSGRLTVQVPTNTSLAPPGYYMLFLLNSSGVPSIAPIIKIAANISLPPPPNGPTNTPPPPPPTVTPTRTPIPPTATATPIVGSFPTRGILDNFNRANGSVGTSWGGSTSGFAIAANQLNTTSSNSWMMWKTRLGATQEAYITLKTINATATAINLLLKSQNDSTWESGVMQVWYQPTTHLVKVFTFTSAQDWVQRGANISVTFNPGDRFGARARADGFVEVYRNSTLLATVDARGWTYATSTGYAGLWMYEAQNTQVDDFGGG